jgi:UPF0755 protein
LTKEENYIIPKAGGKMDIDFNVEIVKKGKWYIARMLYSNHIFSNSMKWRAQELNLSIREVVTLASLIEKETSSREERFLISSVFHNRLRRGMGMDCDPTIIYALKRDNLYDGKLGWKDLKYDSPYNTRLYRGLPPGPICSPGFDSLEAALYPENTKYLFFVAKDSRSHYFSETLAEHNRAVRKYIINRKRN